MDKTTEKKLRRERVKRRVRSKIRGTAERPRLSIYKSNKHVYAQLVDDLMGETLIATSTQAEGVADEVEDKSKKESAAIVGAHLADLADEKGIEKAVFDRSGYKYHGVVKALADGAREAGLDF